jgi:multiple sugar transport system ATP-binding protein
MVFQTYALVPHMTVRQNMGFGLRMARVRRDEAERRVRQAAAMLQIQSLLDRKPRELSGGQRQRVAIGRAIVRNPKVFLFDEPLSNLDASLRVATRVEIAKIHRKVDATTIYVTHDQIEAMTLADRIVVMNNGQVEQVGTPLDLYHHPINVFVAGFIGSPPMNLLPATALRIGPLSATISINGGDELEIPCLAEGISTGDRLTLGVRPENLRIDDESLVSKGPIAAVERLGDETFLYVDGEIPGQIIVVKTDGEAHFHVGEVVSLSAGGRNCHLFDANGKVLPHVPSRAQSDRRR